MRGDAAKRPSPITMRTVAVLLSPFEKIFILLPPLEAFLTSRTGFIPASCDFYLFPLPATFI
jgi:hypothetical protein